MFEKPTKYGECIHSILHDIGSLFPLRCPKTGSIYLVTKQSLPDLADNYNVQWYMVNVYSIVCIICHV